MANIFTLEALEAQYGDCLLLHYGSEAAPRLIVIDGGPKGVYQTSLRPRLNEIRAARGGGQFELRMLMVSHIDDDHIAGVLEFVDELIKAFENKQQLPFDILTLWHNSFDDIIAKMGAAAADFLERDFKAQMKVDAAGLATSVTHGNEERHDAAAIVAGVDQGRRLRLQADTLAINMNSGFDDLIQFDKAAKALNIGAGLAFTVLGPRKAELDALKKKWASELDAILDKEKKKAAAAEFLDKSVHNLSSLVVLAEFNKKRMLLTGDARGDFIMKSLDEAKLLTNGTIDVDVLKMPHHGSRRDIAVDFFKTVRARHYVVSANGKYGNPDPPTFTDLFAARPVGPYDIWLTNDVKPAVALIERDKPAGVTLHLPKKAGDSVRVELGAAIQW